MDDTAAIQGCLNLVSIKRQSLYFPAGDYKITNPLNFTANGEGNGGKFFGDGYSTNIIYFPPQNGTSIADGFGGMLKAGAINFGSDNFKGTFYDFRVTLGGLNKNGSCGLKFFKWFQGTLRNIIVDGFECGIHLSDCWSNSIIDCKIYNSRFGILWDNTTIGTIRGCDIQFCNIAIYFGWNLFGNNTSEPDLFAQGFTISENTIQSCSEAAIVGKNAQVVTISGNYTEGNCAGPYPTLLLPEVTYQNNFDGSEIIITTSNTFGNSKIAIRDNWFWLNKAITPKVLGIRNVYGLTLENNSYYSTEHLQTQISKFQFMPSIG